MYPMKMTWILTLLTLSTGWMAAQDRMTDTLRKAVVEEESQHNLTAAVQDYQAVVAQFDESRKTVATALFRLADCYRKQHKDDEAKRTYQRVVHEFADQTKLAEQSRAVLAATYKIAPPVTTRDQAERTSQAEARGRYRALLLQEINLANDNLKRVREQVNLGAFAPESMIGAERQKLQLERELAAFDMGIMPADITGRR
jgi:hypothetical protein